MNRTLLQTAGIGLAALVVGSLATIAYQVLFAVAGVDCSDQGIHCIKVRVDADVTQTPTAYTVVVDAPTIQNKGGQSQVLYWNVEKNQDQGFDFGSVPNPATATTGIVFASGTGAAFVCTQLNKRRIQCTDPTAAPGKYKYTVTVTNGTSNPATTDPYVVNN